MTIDLDSSLRALHAKRTELLNQVDAIDTALAAARRRRHLGRERSGTRPKRQMT